MCDFKYDILNNNYNINIVNNKYKNYQKELLFDKKYIFLNNFFNYLINKKEYNLIKKLIKRTLHTEKNVFRFDYNTIKEFNIENKKKYNSFENNYKVFDYKVFDYNKHFKNKNTNIYNNIIYNKKYLIDINNLKINNNITEDFLLKYKNINNMIKTFNNLDILIKKKFFYIKQYEEYLYSLNYIFTI